MGRTTALRREIKRVFVPFMREQGFQLDQRHGPHFLDFRRQAGAQMLFLELQWDKSGRPRFTVNFGKVAAEGVVIVGQHRAASDVGPGQAPAYCRLHPRGKGGSTANWFRQDRSLLSALLAGSRLHPPEQPVRELIALFPEVQAWWDSHEVGPHCKLIQNWPDASSMGALPAQG